MTPATNRQLPDNAILDHFNKQVYLGNRYTFVLPITSAGTSEVAQLVLQNPAQTANAFPLQIGPSSLFVDLRQLSGASAITTASVMRVYLNPTISALGTAKTPINMRKASTNASIGVLHSAPTASANGTLVEVLTENAPVTVKSNELIILDPGQSLLITIQTENSAIINAQLSWYEI